MPNLVLGTHVTLQETPGVSTSVAVVNDIKTMLCATWVRDSDDRLFAQSLDIDSLTLTPLEGPTDVFNSADAWRNGNSPVKTSMVDDGWAVTIFNDTVGYPISRTIQVSSNYLDSPDGLYYDEAGIWGRMCHISDGKMLTVWQRSSDQYCRACIVNIDGAGDQTKNTIYTAVESPANEIYIFAMDSTKAIVLANIGTSPTLCGFIANISGNNLSFGAVTQLANINASYIHGCKIDTDKFVVAFQDTSNVNGYIIPIIISGANFSIGEVTEFSDGLDVWNIDVCEAGKSACFIAFRENTNNIGKTVQCKINWYNKTITVMDAEEITGGTLGGGTNRALQITHCTSNSLVMIYRDFVNSNNPTIIMGGFEPIDEFGWPFLLPGEEPHRVFTIGGSDFSDRVLQWPTISRTSNEIKSASVRIPLANGDRALNGFYDNVYTINNSCELIITTTDSSQAFTVFRGFLKDVQYANEKCIVYLKDRLWDFNNKIVGNSTIPASFNIQIPSDIAWTLCTCYGGLDDTQGTENTDIEYDSFLNWAYTFSFDNVEVAASFPGVNVSDALQRLSEMTNSDIWVDREGKINFKARIDIDSSDTTFINDWIKDVSIDIGTTKLVNRQHVYGNYSVESQDWFINVVDDKLTSQDSYGIHERVLKNENVWHTSSVDMLVLAGKITGALNSPPKVFNVRTPLMTIQSDIGDRVRFVDSFFDITSASSWRIVGNELDMDTGVLNYELDGAASLMPFILDYSLLDGDDLLL